MKGEVEPKARMGSESTIQAKLDLKGKGTVTWDPYRFHFLFLHFLTHTNAQNFLITNIQFECCSY